MIDARLASRLSATVPITDRQCYLSLIGSQGGTSWRTGRFRCEAMWGAAGVGADTAARHHADQGRRLGVVSERRAHGAAPLRQSRVPLGGSASAGGWPAALVQGRIVLDVQDRTRTSRGCRRSPCPRAEDERSVDAVPVQEPASQKQCRAPVSLREPLRPRHTAGHNGCHFDWILDRGDGGKGAFDTPRFLQFVESVVGCSNRPVKGSGEFERGDASMVVEVDEQVAVLPQPLLEPTATELARSGVLRLSVGDVSGSGTGNLRPRSRWPRLTNSGKSSPFFPT